MRNRFTVVSLWTKDPDPDPDSQHWFHVHHKPYYQFFLKLKVYFKVYITEFYVPSNCSIKC